MKDVSTKKKKHRTVGEDANRKKGLHRGVPPHRWGLGKLKKGRKTSENGVEGEKKKGAQVAEDANAKEREGSRHLKHG